MSIKNFWGVLDEVIGPGFAEDPEIHESVQLLSRGFTDERASLRPDYFADPGFRRGYLAYFLPLNFLKTRLLLAAHAPKVRTKDGVRILDFGAGPATASLAALDYLSGFKPKKIEICIVENQPDASRIAKELLEKYAAKLELNVEVECLKSIPDVASTEPFDLVFAVNVLNELSGEDSEYLLSLWNLCAGAFLLLEPSHRVASQRLVRFRERVLKDFSDEVRILGPCLHMDSCPVNRTENWCHFSEASRDGRLEDLSLRVFKDPRRWLKFSYVFFRRATPAELIAATEDPTVLRWKGFNYRAIGDLHPVGGKKDDLKNYAHGSGARFARADLAIDLCMPGKKKMYKVADRTQENVIDQLHRGCEIHLDNEKIVKVIKFFKPK